MSRQRAKVVRRGGGFLGKFVALLLGFILGIVGTIGGLVGGGYFLVSNVKIKDAVNGVSSITGAEIDYSQYITEEYAEKTVLGLIGSLGEVATEFSNGTGSLSTLEKISPLVRTTVEELTASTAEFGVPIDAETLMTTPFAELADFATQTMNSVELGKVLQTVGFETSILKLLCYGEEGVHYTVENGEVVMLGSNKPLTIGDLTHDEGINGVLGKISLAALIESTGEVNAEDAIMRTLLYGAEGVDYDIVNGEIVMRDILFAYDATADAFMDDEKNVYLKTADGYANENGMVIKKNTTQAVSTAAATEYEYSVYDKNGNLLYELKTPDGIDDGYFAAYNKGVQQKHRGITLGDLLGGTELTELFGEIYLGDLLDLKADSDPIMLALAYGEKGVDYTVNGNEIVPVSEPTSLGSLMEGDVSGLLERLKLPSLLGNISPLDTPKPNKLLLLLCYGEEGVHYDIVSGEIVWNTDPVTGEAYSARSVQDLMQNTDSILETLTISGLLDISPLDTPKPNNLLLVLAYGEEGVHYEIVSGEIVWNTDPVTGERYGPRSFQDLMNDPNSLFESMTLGALLDVSPLDTPKPDPLLLVLAYGEEGVHYEIIAGEIVWKTNPETGEQYAPRSLLALMENPDSLLNDMSLASVLSVTPSSDAIMLQLAYGGENRYTVNGETIEMNPVKYTLLGTDVYDDTQKKVGVATFVKTVSGESVYKLSDNEYLRGSAAIGYYAYTTQEKAEGGAAADRILYKKTTLSDLRGNAATEKIENIELGVALGIDILTSTDKLMLAFAYGYEGVQYQIVSGEVVWNTNPLTGLPYKPRTIKDMKTASAIINDIRLETVLDLENNSSAILEALAYDKDGNPLTIGGLQTGADDLINSIELNKLMTGVATDDTLMMFLLYGEKGVHYEIGLDGSVTMLPMQLAILGSNAYDVYGEKLTATVTEVAGVGYTVVIGEKTYYLSLAHYPTENSVQKTVKLKEGDAKLYYVSSDTSGTVELFKPRTLGEFTSGGSVVNDLMKALTIGDFVGGEISQTSSPLLYAIQDWKIDDLQNQNAINALKLSDIMNIDVDKPNTPAIMKTISSWTIGQIQDPDTFNKLYINQLITIDTESSETPAIMKTISGWTVEKMQDPNTFNNLLIEELITIDKNSPPILLAMQENQWKLSDMQSAENFNNLLIEDLIKIDSNSPSILLAMQKREWTLGHMQSADNFNSLTLVEVLGEKAVAESEYFRTIGDTPISNLSSALDSLKITHLFAHDIYKTIVIDKTIYFAYTDSNGELQRLYETEVDGTIQYYEDASFSKEGKRELKGAWRYMLQNPETGNVEEDLELSKINTMIDNMTANIQQATLNQLVEDDIIDLGTSNIVDNDIKTEITVKIGNTSVSVPIGVEKDENGRPVLVDGKTVGKIYKYTNGEEKDTVGELTINEMIDYLSNIFDAISHLETPTHTA